MSIEVLARAKAIYQCAQVIPIDLMIWIQSLKLSMFKVLNATNPNVCY